LHVHNLVVGHQGHDGSYGPSACGTAGTVQVPFVLDRWVGMDDQCDVIDMNPARSDVSRDKRAHSAVGEGQQVTGTRVLIQIAVQFHGWNARRDKRTTESFRPVLRSSEHQGAARPSCQLDQDREPIGLFDVQDMVRCRRYLVGQGIDAVSHWIAHEPPDEDVDGVVQRRREQQPLTAGRSAVHYAAHHRQKPEICHVICLVENRYLNVVER
jgi:hypothetical protein